MSTLQVNELLCFLTVQFDKIDRENLISTLIDSYVYREALEAKNILISECDKASISDSIKEYTKARVEGKAGALKRVITDAVNIWTVIDRELVGKISCQFVAANPNRLPSANVEKFSLQFLIASIEKLHEKIDNQDKQIQLLSEKANNNNNNNNNNNRNKRRLSGSSASFTPKHLQTGIDSFVSSPSVASASSPTLVASLLPAPDTCRPSPLLLGASSHLSINPIESSPHSVASSKTATPTTITVASSAAPSAASASAAPTALSAAAPSAPSAATPAASAASAPAAP